MDGDADQSSSLWTAEAMLSKFFLASEAENLNPPSKIAFLLQSPLQCMNFQKYLSPKIHQDDLATPTHETFCLLCGVHRYLRVPPPYNNIRMASERGRGEGGVGTSAMNDATSAEVYEGEGGGEM